MSTAIKSARTIEIPQVAKDKPTPDRGFQVNFRAPKDLYERLERVANVLGLDLSNLVRMVIRENLAAYERRADQIEQDEKRGKDD